MSVVTFSDEWPRWRARRHRQRARMSGLGRLGLCKGLKRRLSQMRVVQKCRTSIPRSQVRSLSGPSRRGRTNCRAKSGGRITQSSALSPGGTYDRTKPLLSTGVRKANSEERSGLRREPHDCGRSSARSVCQKMLQSKQIGPDRSRVERAGRRTVAAGRFEPQNRPPDGSSANAGSRFAITIAG